MSSSGSTLRRRRERARLTQAQLAERVATTQATVARIERGCAAFTRIMGDVTIRVDLGDDLPACLEVRHGDRGYRVVPLAELERGDTDLARLLRRCRERS